MSKLLKATDPQKASVISALKAKTGATKVTQIVKTQAGVFLGHCLKYVKPTVSSEGKKSYGKYESLGIVSVHMSEIIVRETVLIEETTKTHIV